jgi:hypothetical protein
VPPVQVLLPLLTRLEAVESKRAPVLPKKTCRCVAFCTPGNTIGSSKLK